MDDVKRRLETVAARIEANEEQIEDAGYSVIYLYRDHSGGAVGGCVCGDFVDITKLVADNIRYAADFIETALAELTGKDNDDVIS